MVTVTFWEIKVEGSVSHWSLRGDGQSKPVGAELGATVVAEAPAARARTERVLKSMVANGERYLKVQVYVK